MSGLNFDNKDFIQLPTKHHGDVTLSKRKWDIICSQPERQWYKFNSEKVATTLVTPDHVRHHSKESHQIFYYKEFESYKLNEYTTVPMRKRTFFAVIIDTNSGKVCTVYPVSNPKKGKEFDPEKNGGLT